ncbi:MAG TPA: response regulator [Bacteroidia bacterium]|jgi:DNA-binding response OmpR family regulator|nr:response regulator [Bacteroidia bacterium]
MNILIIEDDTLTLKALKHTIESLGHTVSVASNAEEAINKIPEGKYDLVLSDIMMPGISGLSLITILRSVHLCTTPIIVMSVLNDKPLLQAAHDAGANDFISKPIAIEELSAKIEKFNKSDAMNVNDIH